MFVLVVPALALAAFPGPDPDEGVRLNTPDDPGFDDCESDNEQGPPACSSAFDEQYERFGFAPEESEHSAEYDPAAAPARQVAQNLAAGRNPLGQVSGVSADRAWKYFGEAGARPGDPEVEVAILDTGIRWNREELQEKVALNQYELPEPQCGADDCDGDGAFNVADYAGDSRVSATDGNPESDGELDPSDLIARFSDGADDDANGYADDIAGWDFFDDDNDPYDASSYASAADHGSARAEEAAAETDNGIEGTGVCPECQLVPLRVWDTFVVDSNNFGQGVLYAADNGIEVVEGAVGGLTNTRFARAAFAHAYERGVFLALVSSDLNTANHNYPTNYDEALFVGGTVADQTPISLGGLAAPGPGLFDYANDQGLPLAPGSPVGTWFRNSGTTQYGGHAHVVMPAVTGSEATGQASGAAALVASYGRLRAGRDELPGGPLEPNEIKQLLTLTAEDVHPLNTDGVGVADPAQAGWDQHFGYGRPDLGLALERIRSRRVPPQALITSPDWFAPLNVDDQARVEVDARLSADRAPRQGDRRYDWELQWAPGIEPCEVDFVTAAGGSGSGELDATLGTIDLAAVRAALDARTMSSSCPNPPAPVDGGSTPDPTAPARGPGDVDPNEPAFTVRLVVTDTEGNRGEDRRVLFAHRDPTLHEGWARPIGGEANHEGNATTGGEASQRMFDLDGDNRLELIEATSSGELHAVRADGEPLASFNGGEPVVTAHYANVHSGAPSYQAVEPPREVLRTPAIGDVDDDLEPEIVDSAGEHVYAWEADGSAVEGFPVRLDPSLSEPADRSRENHVKRGFIASPSLGNLDQDDGLEIVVPALDGHLYAWNGDGTPLAGYPVRLRDRDQAGQPIPCSANYACAETINTAAIGDIAGDSRPEIVVPTAELDQLGPGAEPPPALEPAADLLDGPEAQVSLLASGRVYALDAGGDFLAGWPKRPIGLLPDIVPLVAPGIDHALGNVDGDPELEVVGSMTTGGVIATDGDGSPAVDYDSVPAGGEHINKGLILNLFEHPVVADLGGEPGPEVLKAGITLNAAINLALLPGQNLPYNHVLQAWTAGSGESLPAYPQAIEDYQYLTGPAVADVSDAPGAEAILGTGLYLIRNLNASGIEGAGWPKFTGGWNIAVPAVGDVDADGELEVSAMTREGFSFLWDTDRPACGSNEEWWTSHHDEWSTSAYGTDSRPPGTADGLEAVRNPDRSVELRWTAPGDDWLCGSAKRLRVNASASPIERPTDGAVIRERSVGEQAGASVVEGFSEAELGDARHLAVLYRDEAGNWGRLAATAVPAVEQPPPGPGPRRCANLIEGGSGGDTLRGTNDEDEIRGRGGKDRLLGRGADDCLFGGGGADRVRGGRGEDEVRGGDGKDRIEADDGDRDEVRCGSDRDLAIADREDRLRGCERVKRK